MKGFLGPYSMSREGSGTSWLPDTTPHEGIHGSFGEWTTMWHALLNGVYDQQGGPRGGQEARGDAHGWRSQLPKLSTAGQVQKRLRSPYTLSMRATAGQNLWCFVHGAG